MQVLDGRALAAEIKTNLTESIQALKVKTDRVPGLTVVIVGKNPASQGYVRSKHKTASELGIHSQILELEQTIAPEQLIQKIETLNRDPAVHALLVQLPLPAGMNTWEILEHMDPKKDVDRFLPVNLGKIMLNETSLFPCTPAGILGLLDRYDIDVTGMNAVVVGRSFIVGKPIAAMLTNRNATVTICHSKTRNLAGLVGEADLLVAASGRAASTRASAVASGPCSSMWAPTTCTTAARWRNTAAPSNRNVSKKRAMESPAILTGLPMKRRHTIPPCPAVWVL